MKKNRVIIFVYLFYFILMTLLSSFFSAKFEAAMTSGLNPGFGHAIRLLLFSLTSAIFSALLFLLGVYLLDNRIRRFGWLQLVHVNIFAAFIGLLVMDFVLWISRFTGIWNDIRKIFILAAICPALTVAWVLLYKIKKTAR